MGNDFDKENSIDMPPRLNYNQLHADDMFEDVYMIPSLLIIRVSKRTVKLMVAVEVQTAGIHPTVQWKKRLLIVCRIVKVVHRCLQD